MSLVLLGVRVINYIKISPSLLTKSIFFIYQPQSLRSSYSSDHQWWKFLAYLKFPSGCCWFLVLASAFTCKSFLFSFQFGALFSFIYFSFWLPWRFVEFAVSSLYLEPEDTREHARPLCKIICQTADSFLYWFLHAKLLIKMAHTNTYLYRSVYWSDSLPV